MGKAKRDKVHKEHGESMTMKERIVKRMDESNDDNAAKTRANFLDRWMEMCGSDDPYNIDHSEAQPIIHLEWFLCDPRVLAKLTGGQETRDEVVNEMMDDLQRQVYLNCKDYKGCPYTDIEKQSFSKEYAKQVKAKYKRKK